MAMPRSIRPGIRHRRGLALLAVSFAAGPLVAGGPEVGGNDVRISAAGGVGDASYGAFFASAAVNPDAGEVLVCWEGEDDVELAPQEREIFCQRLDAASGAEIGDDFRVSDMGGLGSDVYDAREPFVVYDGVDELYLVVWAGSDDTPPLVVSELEIFGQLLAGTDAAEVGANDFRVSDMGPDGNVTARALYPVAAFNATDGEFLVCWEGVDMAPGSSESEIYCQRLDGATGGELGLNDRRVSDMGPDGSFSYAAQEPALAWASGPNEYLVVWWGDDDTPPLVRNEDEIFAQRLAGATGAEVGANDFRVSDMGPDGSTAYSAVHPTIDYAPSVDEYLVCWQGDDDSGVLVDGENEIFCQRLAAAGGSEVGANDFRVSAMGPDGDASYDATRPSVAYSAAADRYGVVWYADDDVGGVVDGELELFGQGLEGADGGECGADDFRLSDAGPDGDIFFHALSPVVVATPAGGGELLVAWHGTDDVGGVAPSEHEVYIQRLRADFLFWDGFESGDASAWSLASP
ncbi:MAG: hypothetical protein K8I65_00955 [Thermoanaerobaculia bacterium]|nr:hypothetical protein [Thermoanaerobaculia bacterium]